MQSQKYLSLLVDQLLEIVHTDLSIKRPINRRMRALVVRKIGNSQHKADGIQNIGFATAVETGNGIESRVPSSNLSSISVRLKAVDNQFLDPHGDKICSLLLKIV